MAHLTSLVASSALAAPHISAFIRVYVSSPDHRLLVSEMSKHLPQTEAASHLAGAIASPAACAVLHMQLSCAATKLRYPLQPLPVPVTAQAQQ